MGKADSLRRGGRYAAVAALLASLSTGKVAIAQPAQPRPPASDDSTDEIVVYGRALARIGIATSGSEGVVGYRDFEDKPLTRVGELVENVPGVIATQHSGTGKANQYFLRGFNLDHGTDLATFVDGVPINLRSHGHGQGYTDLNFLIPELVERIDYSKGPYFADVGDFSAAGTVRLTTVDRLAAPIVQATAGSYGYYRGLAAGSLPGLGGDVLLAIDGTLSDGPWVLDERLRKVTALAKLARGTRAHGWSLAVTGYRARWNATDQVPQRAIASGLIDRYGFIDGALGGETTRIGVTGNGRFGDTEVGLYGILYRFRLTSNFTYLLDDPADGDEFRQVDRRGVYGGRIRHSVDGSIAGMPTVFAIGGEARYDHIGKVGLYRSVAGERIGTIREDRVDEASGAVWAEGTASITDRLRLVLGLRGDGYRYKVRARSLPANGGTGGDAMLSPKGALAWRAGDHLELYANYGEAFHSNDVRGATIHVDPVSGDPVDRVQALIKARGGEIGGRAEYPRLTLSAVAFLLDLRSELVFTGDGGTTEPNPASRRYGAEATMFWRPVDWLTLDGAVTATHARFRGVEPGQRRIPNSVASTLSGGAAIAFGPRLSSSIRLRHFGAAPLIEDGSARSDPTTLVNLGIYYSVGRTRLALDILNVTGSRDNDITYFYRSRLSGEPDAGVEDYHLHPVEPRQIRVALRHLF